MNLINTFLLNPLIPTCDFYCLFLTIDMRAMKSTWLCLNLITDLIFFSWENMANRIWLNAVAPFEVRIILWFVNPVEQAKLTRVETPSTQASRSIEQWRGQCFGRDSCPLQLIVTAVIYFTVFQTDTASFVSSGFRVSERLWSRLKEIHVDCC